MNLKNNPFYKELEQTASFKNWSDLPIFNKTKLQKPLSERLSDGFTLKNVYKSIFF